MCQNFATISYKGNNSKDIIEMAPDKSKSGLLFECLNFSFGSVLEKAAKQQPGKDVDTSLCNIQVDERGKREVLG